jgi:hypothetical protein
MSNVHVSGGQSSRRQIFSSGKVGSSYDEGSINWAKEDSGDDDKNGNHVKNSSEDRADVESVGNDVM